jgi:predicted nucleotidyltransferase
MDNKLKIINHLGKHICEEFTMHELSKATDIPYATFHRTIAKIDDAIKTRSVGKAKTITLNTEYPLNKAYLAISSEEEKKEFLKNSPIIRKITTETKTEDTVLVFGSYAKGTQRKDSDIDIMVINKTGKKDISFSRYETLFKVKINPMFFTEKEFKQMIREKEENVGKQALKNHIILKSPEKLWALVLDG